MRIARLRQGKDVVTAVFVSDTPYSLSKILGISEKQISENFYEIIQERRDAIIRAAKSGQNPIQGDWTFDIPIPKVNQIRDFYAFEEHVKAGRKSRGLEMIPEWYEIPVFYYSGNSSIYPSGEGVRYPSYSNALDFELEIAAVIGRGGMNISSEGAMDHVSGFMLVNDWSARDEQKKEMKLNLGPVKSKDFGTSMGPFLITSDEILEYGNSDGKLNVHVEAYVNGRKYSEANLKTIYWSFGDMIERASKEVMLREGDIIMSGTVGTGCIMELGPEKYGWLKRGDKVIFRSEVLGNLENVIV